MPGLLSADEIQLALLRVPHWRKDGAEIVRVFRFNSYMDGVAFVNEVARLAEVANHHPEICLGWRKVTLRLSTHSKGGLTALDFALAENVERNAGGSSPIQG